MVIGIVFIIRWLKLPIANIINRKKIVQFCNIDIFRFSELLKVTCNSLFNNVLRKCTVFLSILYKIINDSFNFLVTFQKIPRKKSWMKSIQNYSHWTLENHVKLFQSYHFFWIITMGMNYGFIIVWIYGVLIIILHGIL